MLFAFLLTFRAEFLEHGLNKLVTLTHADAIIDGYGIENIADCVFLDLPEPWLALGNAKKTLKVYFPLKHCQLYTRKHVPPRYAAFLHAWSKYKKLVEP